MNKKLRKTIIAGNWKMNMLASEVGEYSSRLMELVPGFKQWCDVVICAPYVLIPAAIDAFKGTGVEVGAQNVSRHASGAYTGSVSPQQLCDVGTQYTIIGHSERRDYYAESDRAVNEKLQSALKSPLSSIVCVGETLRQRECGITFDLISMQVKVALLDVTKEQLKRVVIAYEPVWAIGTGKTATPQDAEDVCRAIRGVVESIYDKEASDGISILYGGSMNDKNAYELLAQPDIDGGLIGGASLKPETFAEIICAAKQ